MVYFSSEILKKDPSDVTSATLEATARSVRSGERGYRGGNALTLLYATTGAVPGRDWSSLNLDGARLIGADLNEKDFRKSSLRWCRLDNVSLRDADLRDADLTGVRLEETSTVTALVWSAAEQSLLAAYTDSSIRRWRSFPGGHWDAELVVDSLPSPATALLVGPQAQLGVIRLGVGDVYINDDGEYIRAASFPIVPDIQDIAVRSDDILVVSDSADGVRMSGPVGAELGSLSDMGSRVRVALIEDGVVVIGESELVVVGGDSPPHREEHGVGELTGCTARRRSPVPHVVAAIGNRLGTVRVFEVNSGARREISAFDVAISAIEFVSDDLMAVAGADGSITLLGVTDPTFRREMHRRIDCTGLRYEGVKTNVEYQKLRALTGDT